MSPAITKSSYKFFAIIKIKKEFFISLILENEKKNYQKYHNQYSN